MDEEKVELCAALIEKWRTESKIEANLESLKRVNQNLGQRFTFPELNDECGNSIREIFLTHFPDASVPYQCALLELVKILCRDKDIVTQLFSQQFLELVLKASGIYPGYNVESFEVVSEGVKCAYNAIFNSVVARTIFEEKCETIFMRRIHEVSEHFQGSEEPYGEQFSYLNAASKESLEALLFFDLRTAFVASAHSIELQKKWVGDNDKVNTLLAVLKFSCQKLPIIEARKTEWATEVLRIFFVIYNHAQIFDIEVAQDCANEFGRLVTSQFVEDEMKQNAVHILSIIPICLPPLCPELSEDEAKKTTKIYEGCDMRFVDAVLEVMARKIDKTSEEDFDQLGTFFAALIHLCKDHKAARRYCRLKVIPPLKAQHVELPPDKGETLRNKCIRVMMSTSKCAMLAGEFLFVLCKRSVPRLIKYTGLGHSAGLLANYGFLGKINEHKRESDSEDSETESYNEVRDRVHPVTGYIQPERGENPFDNMSEEQKEYEAMKLANAMDKLMSEGIFRPGTVGPDGKPVAVSHVNELVKNISSENEKDSDSD